MSNDKYRCAKFHSKFPLTLSSKQHDSSRVNPVPRTYVRGFGPLPLHDVTSIHPRSHTPGLVWYGVKGPIRSFGRLNQLISSVYAQTSSET